MCRGGWWLKWKLLSCWWRIGFFFAEIFTFAEKLQNEQCVKQYAKKSSITCVLSAFEVLEGYLIRGGGAELRDGPEVAPVVSGVRRTRRQSRELHDLLRRRSVGHVWIWRLSARKSSALKRMIDLSKQPSKAHRKIKSQFSSNTPVFETAAASEKKFLAHFDGYESSGC